jgi:hypothetical protein
MPESAGLVDTIWPAAEIARRIVAEAEREIIGMPRIEEAAAAEEMAVNAYLRDAALERAL